MKGRQSRLLWMPEFAASAATGSRAMRSPDWDYAIDAHHHRPDGRRQERKSGVVTLRHQVPLLPSAPLRCRSCHWQRCFCFF